jgi:hypothetical protein
MAGSNFALSAVEMGNEERLLLKQRVARCYSSSD